MRKLVTIVAMVGLLAMCVASVATLPRVGQDEIDTGKDAAIEAEKEHHLLCDDKLLARVQTIGSLVAAAANSSEVSADYGSSRVVPFSYTFKVVDSEDVNAFSLPGGHIYVYRGLIDICESDHELAAVIAHEVAHAAHHHMVYLLREQSKLEGRLALLLMAGLAGKIDTPDMSNIMAGAQFYKVASVSGYGQKAEADADLTGLTYMKRAGYNPVGMLTFLERLAEHPELVDWGIFQTHPRAADRASLVKARLKSLGIPINRRNVTTSSTAKVETSSAGAICEVTVGGRTVCRTRDGRKATGVAERINSLLDTGLQMHEMRVVGPSVIARGEVVVDIADDDAVLAGKPSVQLADQAATAIRGVLFKQIVSEGW